MDKDCKHSGTTTLMPCEDEGLKVLPWCFYLEKKIEGDCPKDCPHKDKPVQSWEP